jgi:hypothetical protein
MGQVRIVIEYTRDDSAVPIMRWERTGVAPPLVNHPDSDQLQAPREKSTETFELLGRAFEVAQREEQSSFAQSLISFFQGAMVGKQDLAEVLALMKDES